ncbi:hypothetical protein AB0L00_42665 [Actinoallomurus sp. NPDC052308]|uniref:hypothetical protein n=1 Tax=Actinoallomurus sp. NPDC052308 TaxID=3155530 RepID=UPI003422C3F4
MSTATVAVIVIVAVLVVAALGLFAWRQQQRRRLRERFGPEYDRTVERHDSAREAEQELRAREQRHRELQIRDLDPTVRDRYRADWQRVQEHFVDSPQSAVAEADNLLVRVMKDRGYPTEDYEQQVADLSVEHAGTIDRYRTAHDIRGRADAGRASTEDLRQAMVHYRALFAELLGDGESLTGASLTGASRTDVADTDSAPPDAAGHAREARADGPVVSTERAPSRRDADPRGSADGRADESAESRRDAEIAEGRRR